MKDFIAVGSLTVAALRIAAAAVLASGAIFLAYHEKNGWIWFLFCSVLLGYVSTPSTEEE